jgi:ribosomal protein S18 acetylase RimI-like enzyme
MHKIIRIDEKSILDLLTVDIESSHQGDVEHGVSKAHMKKDLSVRFKKGQELFFGYKENGEIKGYVTIKPSFPGHKHCELYWIAVKKRYQGQGIGKALMLFAEEYAVKHGFRKICLYTGKGMAKTRGFYEGSGYSLVNEFPDYYGYEKGDKTAVLYCKKLS